MNKELYIKREKHLEELNKLRSIVSNIEEFLKEYEKIFKRKESINSLKTIRTYFENKKNEYEEIEKIYREIDKEIFTTCKHEVSVKYNIYPSYHCLICGRTLGVNKEVMPELSLLSIDTTNDYKVAYILEKKFKEIVESDLDLVEELTSLVEELQYDRNIKVYRR